MAEPSLQEQIPHNHCFGCGPDNESGLGLKSYWTGEGNSVARFVPQEYHCAAPKHFVNGGIISTLIDCHCVCTAIAAAYFRDGRPIGTPPHYYYATARLSIDYLRPSPINRALELDAEIMQANPRSFDLRCKLLAEAKVCAEAVVTAIQVDAAWMRARR